jgi:hypothetical protein
MGTNHVLTCAHAVRTPDAKVLVDCVQSGVPPVLSEVVDGCWVPLDGAGRGDVALLELVHSLDDGLGAPVRRLPPTRNRTVYTFGYPNDFPQGVAASATLAGASRLGDEWVRLKWTSPGQRLCRGFPGAAVVDEATGHVIGMVVGRYAATPGEGVWMLPIETIVGHIPKVAGWVTGTPATDRAFVQESISRTQNDEVARALTNWLAEVNNNVSGTNKVVLQARDIHVEGNFVVIVTGDSDSARSMALRRTVVMSDRELRPRDTEDIVATAPEGTVPPVGSIDVAIDTSGRTVQEVLGLIADRMGVPVDQSKAPGDQLRNNSVPMTLVLNGVDDAVDPDALLELVKVLGESGCRVVLGFRRESSTTVSSALSWLSGPRVAHDSGPVDDRLARLATQIAELDTAERQLRDRGDRVSVPPLLDHAVVLRTRLTGLRLAARKGQEIRLALEACERAVERALTKVHAARRDFDQLLARRNELRGLLKAYKSMAETRGLVEDIELAALYRQAHGALWHAPCEVPSADRLVGDYIQAVRRKLGTRPDGAAS